MDEQARVRGLRSRPQFGELPPRTWAFVLHPEGRRLGAGPGHDPMDRETMPGADSADPFAVAEPAQETPAASSRAAPSPRRMSRAISLSDLEDL